MLWRNQRRNVCGCFFDFVGGLHAIGLVEGVSGGVDVDVVLAKLLLGCCSSAVSATLRVRMRPVNRPCDRPLSPNSSRPRRHEGGNGDVSNVHACNPFWSAPRCRLNVLLEGCLEDQVGVIVFVIFFEAFGQGDSGGVWSSRCGIVWHITPPRCGRRRQRRPGCRSWRRHW